MKSNTLRLLLVGGSGAVGQQVLRLALEDKRIAHVIAPTRRPLPAHPKLDNPVVDFAALPENASWWQVDAVICTLGTTIKTAGSEQAFAAIDLDLPVLAARLARQAGATRFALNSSLGANPRGNFYLRTKAQAEQAIRELGYPTLTIVRPSLIDAVRAEPRLGEQFGLMAAGLLRPLIPRRYRPVKAQAIAHALLEGVMREQAGEQIIESESLQD
ncbi:MAG: NAD(P)H-binding protein [Pseudomonadota bacterium]